MKIELTDPLFCEAQPVLRHIESHGYEAYFVGGCVRDTLLGQKIHDIDIATSATPEEIEAIFRITIGVGKAHGTIIVLENQVPYEITTFRTEGDYSDFRHPDSVDFVRDLKEDTLRRDFTINALALDRYGHLYDYHQGKEDLQQRVIRAVGVAEERFSEDALRTIRAIRFASQLGFTIESETFRAIQTLSHLLPKIAVERIRIEISKFLQGAYFCQSATLLTTSQIAQHLPLFNGLDVEKAMAYMKKMRPQQMVMDERVCWFLLTRGLGLSHDTTRQFLKKWTHSNQFVQEVLDLHVLYPIVKERQLTNWEVYAYSIELIELLERLIQQQEYHFPMVARTMAEQLPIRHKQEIAVNGREVLTWLNLEKGNAMVGNLLQQIEYQIVTNQLDNQQVAIKHFVLAHQKFK